MLYLTVKHLHILFAGLTLALFVLRGGFAVVAAQPLRHRIWKVLPHIVDTVLLALGVWLAFMLQLNPLHVTWLGVKLLCVIAYIVLGILAFRIERPYWVKLALFAAAIAMFAFIVSIALLHNPLGVFACG